MTTPEEVAEILKRQGISKKQMRKLGLDPKELALRVTKLREAYRKDRYKCMSDEFYKLHKHGVSIEQLAFINGADPKDCEPNMPAFNEMQERMHQCQVREDLQRIVEDFAKIAGAMRDEKLDVVTVVTSKLDDDGCDVVVYTLRGMEPKIVANEQAEHVFMLLKDLCNKVGSSDLDADIDSLRQKVHAMLQAKQTPVETPVPSVTN